VSESGLKRRIKGTFLAALPLAAQEGDHFIGNKIPVAVMDAIRAVAIG
jgi:hypothetical protein